MIIPQFNTNVNILSSPKLVISTSAPDEQAQAYVLSLADIYEAIRTGDYTNQPGRIAGQTVEARNKRAVNADAYAEIKKHGIPAYIPGATYEHSDWRNINRFEAPTGLRLVEIDHLKGETPAECRDRLFQSYECIVMAYISLGGDGVHTLVAVEGIDGVSRGHGRVSLKQACEAIGVPAPDSKATDRADSVGDFNRRVAMPYDPECRFRADAKPIAYQPSDEVERLNATRNYEPNPELAEQAMSFEGYVPSSDYAEWLRQSAAAKKAGVSFECWDAWCSRGDGYDAERNAEKWETALDGLTDIGVGTHFYFAQLAGWEHPGRRSAFEVNADGFRDACSYLGVELRFNAGKNVEEYRTGADCRLNIQTGGEWRPVSDRVVADIAAKLELHCFMITGADKDGNPIHKPYDISQRKIDAYIISVAASNAIDEPLEWLNGLPEWDGVERAKHLLRDILGAEDDAYTQTVSLLGLAGIVARILRPGYKFDCVPLLRGPGGIGKSQFPVHLMPEHLRDDYTIEGFDFDSRNLKENYERILGRCVVEMAEFQRWNENELGKLKSFISTRSDTFRSSYGRRAETHYRRCVIWATADRDAIVDDEAGHRRVLPVVCAGKDRAVEPALAECREQVFAEVLNKVRPLVAANKALEFPRDMYNELQRRNNALLAVDNSLEDQVIEYLQDLAKSGLEMLERDGLKIPVIHERITGKEGQNPPTRKYAAILRKLGFEKSDTRTSRGWALTDTELFKRQVYVEPSAEPIEVQSFLDDVFGTDEGLSADEQAEAIEALKAQFAEKAEADRTKRVGL